jgi:hypothetical protein
MMMMMIRPGQSMIDATDKRGTALRPAITVNGDIVVHECRCVGDVQTATASRGDVAMPLFKATSWG